jgi:hypothetical protein
MERRLSDTFDLSCRITYAGSSGTTIRNQEFNYLFEILPTLLIVLSYVPNTVSKYHCVSVLVCL